MQDARTSVQVDLSQYDEITEYCNHTGSSRAAAVREAIALFLRNVKPRRLAAFGAPVAGGDVVRVKARHGQ